MSSNPNSPAQRQLPGRPSGGDQTPSARNASVFRLPLIEPTTIGAEQTGSSDQPGSETSHSPLVTSTRQPTFETYTNASAKDAKDLSKAFVAAKSETAQDLSMMAHKLAKNDLHTLGRQRRLEERLGGIQEGHTLSNISNQVRHRLMSDMRAAGRQESELECIEESPLEFEVGERQLVFNKAIAEETESAEVPEDLEVPVCDCGVPCVYRQYNADPTSTMWVCSLCQCMFFQALTSLKVIETPAGDAVIANMFNDQNLESFWATVGKQMAFPAKPTIDLLLGTVDSSRRCVCDQPCTICICSVTGAVFWVCKTQKCFYILPFDEKQIRLIDNMDVGQLVTFGDSTIDRYTTLGHMMKWFGYSFSVEFFGQLNARESDADYPKGSFLIDPGQQFDGFISYRGGTGRYPLFFTLLGLFNLLPAVVFLYVVCPLFMIPMAYAYDLCEADDPPLWLIFSNSCDRPPNARSWFVFRPYAPSVIVLIVLFWHPVMSFAYANRRYFLDKYCIHQSDNESRKPLAINRLPLFLQSSKVLYSLFDVRYASRMWCVWELAIYLRAHPNPHIIFTSVSMRNLEIYVILVSLVANLIVDAVESATDADAVQAAGNDSIKTAYEATMWVNMCMTIIVTVIVYLLGDGHFRALQELRVKMENYDVTTAELHDEKDRQFLLSVVEELFRDVSQPRVSAGEEKGVTQLLHKFNPFSHSPPSQTKIESKSSLYATEIVVREVQDEAIVCDLVNPRVPDMQQSNSSVPSSSVQQSNSSIPASSETPGSVPASSEAPSRGNQESWNALSESAAESQAADEAEDTLSGKTLSGSAVAIDSCVGSLFSEVDQVNVEVPTKGLEAFNLALKTHVPRQLPLSGMRSWKLLGYKAALVIFGCTYLTTFFDLWCWRAAAMPDPTSRMLQSTTRPCSRETDARFECEDPNDPSNCACCEEVEGWIDSISWIATAECQASCDRLWYTRVCGGTAPASNETSSDELEFSADYLTGVEDVVPYSGWRSILGLVWIFLVLGPFELYLLGCLVKLFLSLHSFSGWPQWTSWCVFLPSLIVVDDFLGWRVQLGDNIKAVVGYQSLMGSFGKYAKDVGGNEVDSYSITLSWVYGPSQDLLIFYNSSPSPAWISETVYTFNSSDSTMVLLWIFVAVPLTIFVYWIYEPRFCRNARSVWLTNLKIWLATESNQPRKSSASFRNASDSSPAENVDDVPNASGSAHDVNAVDNESMLDDMRNL